ncbi:unnamed protein product [Ectocarpus sp. CCAP 1310/34]|nr:unnamed protein product [Ectocarpus sp. CCAP 1310/34]
MGSDYEEEEDEDEDDYTNEVYRAPYAADTHNTGRTTQGSALHQAQQQQQQQASPAAQQQQPQQQQQPSPVGADPSVCRAIIERGQNKGKRCGKAAGGRVLGLCGHHDGTRKRLKAAGTTAAGTTAAAGLEVGAGVDDQANFGSDDELGGGVDELQTAGADAQQSKLQHSHYQRASVIEDQGFREAYESVWHLKKKATSKKRKKRMHKHTGGDKFQLAPSLIARLPKLNRTDLNVLRNFIDGKDKSLPFKFFEEAFPPACQDIILTKTNKYVNFCAEETNPSPLQQPRHRKKKTRTGLSYGSSEDRPDGSKVYGFHRKHVYGVMGILISAGITQKRRLTDHWGVGDHDNYRMSESACLATSSRSSTAGSSTWLQSSRLSPRRIQSTIPSITSGRVRIILCE